MMDLSNDAGIAMSNCSLGVQVQVLSDPEEGWLRMHALALGVLMFSFDQKKKK